MLRISVPETPKFFCLTCRRSMERVYVRCPECAGDLDERLVEFTRENPVPDESPTLVERLVDTIAPHTYSILLVAVALFWFAFGLITHDLIQALNR